MSVAIVLFGKSIAAFAIVLMLKLPLRTALTVSVSLAQIGEFSFILIGLGLSLGLLPDDAQGLVLATALISITLNPALFSLIGPVQGWLRRHPRLCRLLERPDASLETIEGVGDEKHSGHAIVIGCGRVGERVVEQLRAHDLRFVVIDYDRSRLEALRRQGVDVIYGDAASEGILASAGVAGAKLVVSTASDAVQARQVVDIARRTNPDIDLLIRTHDERELRWLQERGVELAIMAERELAASMARYTLYELGVDPERAKEASKEVRASAAAGRALEDETPGTG